MDKVKGQFDAAHDPLRRYRLYARGYGFVVVAMLIIAGGVPAAGAGVSGVLALLSGVYLGLLWVWGGALREKGRGLPHGVTGIRGAAASAIFASSAVLHVYGVSLGDGERWVILGIFTLVESTDLIDGILARRLGGGRPGEGKGAGERGGGGGAGEAEGGAGGGAGAGAGRGRPGGGGLPADEGGVPGRPEPCGPPAGEGGELGGGRPETGGPPADEGGELGGGRPETGGPPGSGGAGGGFGAIWDMECDAAFVLALSTASWLWAEMPAAVLCIGGMRYAYASVLDRPLGLADPPRLYMLFAKSAAAAAALALLISFVPGLSPSLRGALPWIVLPVLVVSFAWDSLLRFRRRRSI